MEFSKQELEMLLDMAEEYKSSILNEIQSLPDDRYAAKTYLYNYITMLGGITEKVAARLGRNPRPKRTRLFEEPEK